MGREHIRSEQRSTGFRWPLLPMNPEDNKVTSLQFPHFENRKKKISTLRPRERPRLTRSLPTSQTLAGKLGTSLPCHPLPCCQATALPSCWGQSTGTSTRWHQLSYNPLASRGLKGRSPSRPAAGREKAHPVISPQKGPLLPKGIRLLAVKPSSLVSRLARSSSEEKMRSGS